MTLTAEQESILDDWLDLKNVENKCSACGQSGFDRNVWEILYFPKIGHVTDPEEQLKPMVSMVCTNCGCTRYFSTELIGLDMTL